MTRPDFSHTSPFFIHESAPGDLPDLEALSCEPWELPEEIDRPLFREPSLWERVRQFFSHAWHG